MPNKGEWGEPYAVLKILGDKKLYIADKNGEKNPAEWLDVKALYRRESANREISYLLEPNKLLIEVYVNDEKKTTVSTAVMLATAVKLAAEIRSGKGRSFSLSEDVSSFLNTIEIHNPSANSNDKSDLYLTLNDPRAAVTREKVGFSVKSEFGHNPTLFNTAPASAVVYKVSGMTDALMNEINELNDDEGHAAVGARCKRLIEAGCNLEFVGFPQATRAKCEAFKENLDLIDSRLPLVIERILWNHFFEGNTNVNLNDVVNVIVKTNPCNITRPETKYPYMIKSFLYAAYCGMTASTLWNGDSQVNGGFIRISQDGEILAFYALESAVFKSYLYDNCYLEFPSTSERHGNYAKVYKEDENYYFRLNFQIRYK